jgi:hypothetical protein
VDLFSGFSALPLCTYKILISLTLDVKSAIARPSLKKATEGIYPLIYITVKWAGRDSHRGESHFSLTKSLQVINLIASRYFI